MSAPDGSDSTNGNETNNAAKATKSSIAEKRRRNGLCSNCSVSFMHSLSCAPRMWRWIVNQGKDVRRHFEPFRGGNAIAKGADFN